MRPGEGADEALEESAAAQNTSSYEVMNSRPRNDSNLLQCRLAAVSTIAVDIGPSWGVLAAAGAANRGKLSGAIRADVPTQCRLEADGSTKNRTVQVNIHAQSGTGLVIE